VNKAHGENKVNPDFQVTLAKTVEKVCQVLVDAQEKWRFEVNLVTEVNKGQEVKTGELESQGLTDQPVYQVHQV